MSNTWYGSEHTILFAAHEQLTEPVKLKNVSTTLKGVKAHLSNGPGFSKVNRLGASKGTPKFAGARECGNEPRLWSPYRKPAVGRFISESSPFLIPCISRTDRKTQLFKADLLTVSFSLLGLCIVKDPKH